MSVHTLENAIRALASVCDGAEEQDGRGFNKPDARWGALMALDSEADWHPSHRWLAWEMLAKYRRQLISSFGIDYDQIPQPERCDEFAPLPEMPKPRPVITATGQAFIVKFDYSADLVAAVKRLPGARFSPVDKSWSVPHAAGVPEALRAFAAAHDFRLSEAAEALLATPPPAPVAPAKPARRITRRGNEWQVTFAYDPALVAEIKAINSRRRFDADSKSWLCEASDALYRFCVRNEFAGADDLHAALDALNARRVEEAEATDAITQALLDAAGDLAAPLPGGRAIVLRAHQQEAVMQLLAAKRAILAHDMGLGKSLTALVAARAAQVALEAHVFVIAPVSLRINWMREAEEAGVEIEFFSWAKVPKAPETGRPVVAIFDEAHYAQSLKSARTKGALALADKALLAMFLTGTPIKNGRPVNLFPLLNGCQHSLAADKTGYERRYCAAKETRFARWDVSGAAHLDELHAKTKDVLFRRTKAQCLDLPALARVKRQAEVSADAAAEYRQVRAEIIAKIEERKESGRIKGSEALEILTALRQAGSRAKTETAIELAEEVIEQGGQVILATQFRATALEIARALNCEALTGSTPGPERQAMVDRFQAGARRAIVMTGQAGGVGLNLQAANTVILVDRPWTPGDSEQIEARAHRSGVQHPVTAIWLQYEAIDTKIDALLEAKQQRIQLVLEGERKTMRGLGGSLAAAALDTLGIDLEMDEDGEEEEVREFVDAA